MTHDDLKERVAVAIMTAKAGPSYGDTIRNMADAAIAIALEEAARCAETFPSCCGSCARDTAAAIRALIPFG